MVSGEGLIVQWKYGTGKGRQYADGLDVCGVSFAFRFKYVTYGAFVLHYSAHGC